MRSAEVTDGYGPGLVLGDRYYRNVSATAAGDAAPVGMHYLRAVFIKTLSPSHGTRQCCCSRGKSFSNLRILMDQLTSPCPRTIIMSLTTSLSNAGETELQEYNR